MTLRHGATCLIYGPAPTGQKGGSTLSDQQVTCERFGVHGLQARETSCLALSFLARGPHSRLPRVPRHLGEGPAHRIRAPRLAPSREVSWDSDCEYALINGTIARVSFSRLCDASLEVLKGQLNCSLTLTGSADE